MGSHVAADQRLSHRVFITIRVTAIHHDVGGQPGPVQQGTCLSDRTSVVIGSFAASAKNHMAIRITRGEENCRLAVLGVTKERMRVPGRLYSLDGDLHIARRSVLETNRAGETRD